MSKPGLAVGFRVLAAVFYSSVLSARAAGVTDIAQDLFVALRDRDHIAVIDPDTKSVVETIEVGLVPNFIAVSTVLNQLVAGGRGHVRVIDLARKASREIAIDVAADRYQLSPSGTRLAAIESAQGRIAIVDLAARREIGRVNHLGVIADAVFGGDGRFIYVANPSSGGVSVVDVQDGTLAPLPVDRAGAVSHLVRDPTQQQLFAARAGSGEVNQLNLDGRANPATLSLSGKIQNLAITPSGRFLLADDDSGRLTAIDARAFKIAASLAGSRNMQGIYAAWFEMVAFVGVEGSSRLLVYDLDRLQAPGEIALRGVPGRGLVTADGAWLFLPIPDARVVQVVDARLRRSDASIGVDGAPVAIALAANFGLCH